MKYDGMLIGQSIRDMRTKKGMTIEQLSDTLDKSVSHIHQIELGSRKKSIDLLLDLVAVLDADANSFLKIESKEAEENKESKTGISIDEELDKLFVQLRDYLGSVLGINCGMVRNMKNIPCHKMKYF